MCITTNYAALSKTKILSLALENGNHFIAYSNKVKNESGKPNSMILPIAGHTSPELFYNTETYKNFLKEITKLATIEEYSGERYRSLGLRSKSLEIFTLGMYTIGLASSYDDVEAYLNSLPDETRPEVTNSLATFFREKYAGWSFAVCVFNNDKTMEAQPIAFEYTPFNADLLYFPTMDAHNGLAPDLEEMVNTDHTLIYEHNGIVRGTLDKDSIHLTADVPAFLNDKRYWCTELRSYKLNGDTYMKISEIKQTPFFENPNFYRAKPIPYNALEINE